MYHLSKFCNIIFELRKERGWTQGVLAEKLNITPQSISKWECGIGYPDVTLFPLIAELFGVDIGVLFGQVKEANGNMNSKNEKKYVKKMYIIFSCVNDVQYGYTLFFISC